MWNKNFKIKEKKKNGQEYNNPFGREKEGQLGHRMSVINSGILVGTYTHRHTPCVGVKKKEKEVKEKDKRI